MIKILFLIPNLAGGGAERVLVNLVNNMDSNQFDITVQTLFDVGNNKQYLNSNIKYKYIFKKSFRGNIHFLKLFSPKYLARKFIKEEYDIAISYLEGPTTRIVSGIQNSATKKVNWVHSDLTKKSLVQSYRNFKEFVDCYTEYDSTVFVSESAKEVFEEITELSNNHIVKYNIVETDRIKHKSYEEIKDITFDTDKINLVTVGRLIEVKGYDRLLTIVKMLVKDDENFHLYILGEGYLERKIHNFIIKNKLEKFVTMLGYKENPYKYVKQADLFVCSSYLEGYSMAVVESLIVGTPVITTSVGIMEKILGHNNEYGLIVDNEEEALYEGLKTILNDKKILDYYKKKAEERASFFDTEKTVKEVEKLLLELYNES